MNLMQHNGRHRSLQLLEYTVLIILILYWGQALFIPLSVALLISFILYPFCNWMEGFKIGRIPAIFIGLMLIFILILLILWLLTNQFSLFMKEWPEIKIKLLELRIQVDAAISNSWVSQFFDQKDGLLGSFVSYMKSYVLPALPKTIYQSSISIILFILIPIYAGLILFYREVLVRFLYHMFPETAGKYIQNILPHVIKTYFNFIKGMGIVYLVVGILNSIGLLIIGIPNPFFFGFIASILTFIPYIGITIGALLPMAVSFLKYDSLLQPIGIIIVFVIVQILEANVIFPLAVSNRLKVNALVTLIVIIGGGIIWGAAGMILFIPFIGILKLIADQVEEMKALSVLLGTRDEMTKTDSG